MRLQYMLSQQQLREIASAFQLFDQDGSGAINFNQMSTALRKMGINLKDQELQNIMIQYDQDGNGQISLQQFTSIVANRFIQNRSQSDYVKVFRAMDRDRDGFISMSDFLQSVEALGLDFTYDQVQLLFNHGAKRPQLGLTYQDMLRLMLYIA